MRNTPDLNITGLTDQLWTGGDLPDSRNAARTAVEHWRQFGIRAVIDNRIEWNDEQLVAEVAPDIAYLHAGVDDAGEAMPDWWFEAVTQFAARHLARGVGVLAHCHMGINRGPSAAFAVMLHQGWEPVAALELIRSARPIAAVDYAEGALDWWHRAAGMPSRERTEERRRLDHWRAAHPHDTVRIVRQILIEEAALR